MTDLPQEERLKSDQLQSLTECEQAIYAIAKKTGKSPLDIWRAQEQELSARVSNVGLRGSSHFGVWGVVLAWGRGLPDD